MKKTIHQLFDEYLYECEFVQHLKPKTLQDYRQCFSLLAKLEPEISLEIATYGTFIRFFKMLQERKRIVGKGSIKVGVEKSTVAKYYDKFNSFFGWLALKGYIQGNPLTGIKRPTPKYDTRQYIDKDGVEKILTAIITKADTPFLRKRNLLIFYILLFCGLRKQELLLLKVRDIDLGKRILTVRAETSKSLRTRHIPLHSSVISALREYIGSRTRYTTPFLIVSSRGDTCFSEGGLLHLIDNLRQASGVRFHLHQLRHTFAVNFLKTSNNVAKLQQLLGHTDPAMTLHYVRCLPPNEMRRDIEVLNIDNFV